MKRLIYITYLGLLALILISCQKETVAPENALATNLSTDDARKGLCRNYQYLTKTGMAQLGNARTDYLLVGFNDNISPTQQETILSQYSIFDQLDGDIFMDSGIITVVKLNNTATCNSVENMLESLERKRQVKFAAPTFNDPDGVFLWIGQTNEIIVTLKNAAYYPHFAHVVRAANCTIVTNLFDQTYIVSADKNSAGNSLQMTSAFNVSPFIESADPNFIFQQLPLKAGKPERKLSKDIMQKHVAL